VLHLPEFLLFGLFLLELSLPGPVLGFLPFGLVFEIFLLWLVLEVVLGIFLLGLLFPGLLLLGALPGIILGSLFGLF